METGNRNSFNSMGGDSSTLLLPNKTASVALAAAIIVKRDILAAALWAK